MNLVNSHTELEKRSSDPSYNGYIDIFKTYYQQVYDYAFRYTRSRVNAEDISQDVFCKLWKHWSRISDTENLKGYIFVAAENECLSYFRKLSRDRRLYAGFGKITSSNYIQDKVLEAQYNSFYHESVQGLPERQRQVFILRREYNYSYKQIAVIMNISTITVNNQITIALKKMRGGVCQQLHIRIEEEKRSGCSELPAKAA